MNLSKRLERLVQQASAPTSQPRPAFVVLHGGTWNGWASFAAEDGIDVVIEETPEADPRLEFLCEDQGTRIYKMKRDKPWVN